MTNFEYWKDKILEINKNDNVAIVKDKPRKCSFSKCNDCDLFVNGESCRQKFFKWLYSEHEEKPKLTKRERILCEAIKSPENKEISRSHGCLYAGEKKIFQLALEPCMFQFIENGSSWLVSDLLLLEVEE